MAEFSPLVSRLRQSAESIGVRGGHLVPLRYGSAAGELAVCLRSVGLIDREDLRVLRISTSAEALDGLTAELVDGGLAPGESALVAHTRWGRLGPGCALGVVPAALVPSICEELLRIPHVDEAEIEETELHAIGMIGPATTAVLTDLGAYGALTGLNGRGRIAAEPAVDGAVWMLLDSASALALVEPPDAVALWARLARAGHPFGLGYVGAEAAERYEAIRC